MVVASINGLHLLDTLLVGDPGSRLFALAFRDERLELPAVRRPSGTAALDAVRGGHVAPDWPSAVLLLIRRDAGSFVGDADVVVEMWHPAGKKVRVGGKERVGADTYMAL